LIDGLKPPGEATTIVLPAGEVERRLGDTSTDAERAALATVATSFSEPGRGMYLFTSPTLTIAVRPPIPPDQAQRLEGWDFGPLLELLGRPRVIALILLRRGGFSVGVFDGDALVASKTGNRFVKNRHRKGGQSQGRYDRMREKHLAELFDKTCQTAWAVVSPHLEQLDAVFLGGDRRTTQEFRTCCVSLRQFGERLQSRFISTPEPRQATLQYAYRELWRSDWIELAWDSRTEAAAPSVS
jgi:peptide subunit release factor 1 (eRF1)